MLQRLPVTFASNTSENFVNEMTNRIFFVSREKDQKKYIQQYNEFNTELVGNRYNIHEFKKQ